MAMRVFILYEIVVSGMDMQTIFCSAGYDIAKTMDTTGGGTIYIRGDLNFRSVSCLDRRSDQ